MRSRILVLVAAALCAVFVAIGPGPRAAAGKVAAARACSVPRYPGTGYFTSLTVSHTGCTTGRRVAVAWYRCRTKSGPAGRCHQQVLHFTCHETRNSIPTEIDARVTCRWGARRVVHTYQQDI